MNNSAYIFRICKKNQIFAFYPSFCARRLEAFGFLWFFSKIWLWSQINKKNSYARGPVDSPNQALFKNVFRFVLSQIGDGTVANFIFFETNFRSLILSVKKFSDKKNPFYSM